MKTTAECRARGLSALMLRSPSRIVLAVYAALALSVLVNLTSLLAQPALDSADLELFEKRIRPVLADTCYKCHSVDSKKLKAGLRVDSRERLLQGGDAGPAIVPGHPEQSVLIAAISYNDTDLQMPPSGKLPDQAVADLREWIRRGAPWPNGGAEPPLRPAEKDFDITAEDGAHWAFQPVRHPARPDVVDAAWVRNPIDRFILARLEARQLAPAPPASKRELVRRVTYDLTGLPPTPEEVDAFLADAAPQAYEALIDRLLASPRYGEKWGRHWLDLVRFAESNSYERDNPKPHAWRFRDYVIRAFNQDKPYDRFIREQLAGDELSDGGADGLIATGYYRLGIWDDEPTDAEQARLDGLDDIITTTAQTFLGLTLDCARCHNHKIDPISQADYYRFLAFFDNINHYRNGGPSDEVTIFPEPGSRQRYENRVQARERRRAELRGELSELEDRFRVLYRAEHGAPDETIPIADLIAQHGPQLLGAPGTAAYSERQKSLEALQAQSVPVDKALCVTETGPQASEVHVRIRGNAHVLGAPVEPGFPEVLGFAAPHIPQPPAGSKSTGRRLALANWIASPDNPLTARVMVNRVWHHHFGRGLVRSPNDFGFQGHRSTHPDLLDWLAAYFVQQGWKPKDLHRLILTSNTYRMASRARAEALVADPENDLFWRFNMRRLTAEEIRDTLLAVSGQLNLKMFGPGVYVGIPPEVLAGQSRPGHGWGESPPEEQTRRSIYIHVKRSLLTPILEGFDLAETDHTTPVRFTSVQPTQALGMLNSRFLQQQAEHLRLRLQREAPDNLSQQIHRALYLATARNPEPLETQRGLDLVRALETSEGMTRQAALKYFCLVVLNLNETLYLN